MAWSSIVMISNSGITVVITVTDSEGVTNLPHYKNSRPENLKFENLSGWESDKAMIKGDHGLINNSNDH